MELTDDPRASGGPGLDAAAPEAPDTQPEFSSRQMLRRTFPTVRAELRRKKSIVLRLVLLGVLLGIAPAIKSELEAGIIEQIDQEISNPHSGGLRDVFSIGVDRFSARAPTESLDLTERLTDVLLLSRQVNLADALFFYAIVIGLAYLGVLSSTSLRSRIRLGVFTKLRREGLRNAMTAESHLGRSAANVPANHATAIQQGATNVADTYDYMIEGVELIFALGTTMLFMVTKSWPFGLACVALVAGQAALSKVQARRLASNRHDLDKHRNRLVAKSDDILQKREIILAYDQRERYDEQLGSLAHDYGTIERQLGISETLYSGLSGLILDAGRIAILVVALALAVTFGRSTIANIGDVYFLIAIYIRLFVPASALLSRYDAAMRAKAESDTFLRLLGDQAPHQQQTHRSGAGDGSKRTTAHDAVRFDAVSFWYVEDDPILENCSFSVPKGQTTMVVGRSGIGKTTIARMVMRFLVPQLGTVFVGGRALKEWDPAELRLTLSYVSQDAYIVEEKLRDNLSWAHRRDGEEIPDEMMMDVLTTLGIARDGHPDILDKEAQELSFGQQQRLSLARMMLDQSDLMILDEPLAGLDVFTRADLHEALSVFFDDHSRSVLMFSHLISFARFANHVIVLDDRGAVAEEGDPAELKNAQGMFARLWSTEMTELNPQTQ